MSAVVQGVGIGSNQSQSCIPSFTYDKQWIGVKIQDGARLGTYSRLSLHILLGTRENNFSAI